MKRIFALVLAAILLTTFAPAMAEDIVISYDGVTVGFTLPTGTPLFEKISVRGEYYFSMIASMEYNGQTKIAMAQHTVDGWLADRLEFFQNMLETDQNADYSNPQVIGPTVWTLESGVQATVLFTSAEYETFLSKSLPSHPVYASCDYYVALPLNEELILTAEFDYSHKVGQERPVSDEDVLSVLNNLTITLPKEQEAASVAPVAPVAPVGALEAAPAPVPAPDGQDADGLIVANMQNGLVLEDSRFIMIENSSDMWDIYLFLAIRNDSSETIALDGSWKAVDANGNELAGSKYPSCNPREIKPGEVGYVAEWDYVSMSEIPSRETVVRVDVSFGEDEYPMGYTYDWLDISGEILHDVEYSQDLLRCTVTNTGSEWRKSPRVVVALYDQNNKLAYVYRTTLSCGQDLYIPGGQQLVIDIGVPNDVSDYYREIGVEFSTFRLMCYCEE